MKLIIVGVLWTVLIERNDGEGVWIVLITCEMRRKRVKVVADLKSPWI